MLFHTPTFLAFFVAFLAFYLPVRRTEAGVWVILLFSNIFYGWWNWKFLGLLWATIVVDYSLGRLLGRTEDRAARRLLLAASLATNLGILGFFKYYNFLVSGLVAAGVDRSRGWQIQDLALPVGISFYVFQSMSYTIDVYRRQQEPVRSLARFAAFVCYFPQLVAGPIERLRHLLPQIVTPAPITAERAINGAFLFSLGFFRKAMADTLSAFVDPVFGHLNDSAPADVVLAVFTFGLQIYLDFTGYVDMARGVSRAIGIDLVVNFDAPYLSTSPREFWRRWHISLSQWLRDYLYISLGGSRQGLPRHLANLMITMLLGGLWHGAGINFIVWGGLHGAYLVLDTLWGRYGPAAPHVRTAASTGRAVLGWLLTFLAVNYAWLYFRSATLADAAIANRKLAQWMLHPSLPAATAGYVLLVAIVALMEILIRFRAGPGWGEGLLPRPAAALARGAFAALFAVVGIVLVAGIPTQQFIYFQF
ncbi:MAG TPA: MBOAT family O-acyltransferase [Usitatibacter sp.]|jgi:D-alanyl-lipoteichoic acid acyltransferase DltB (MBOAT superfamily)|nr:MBOAT family O-acyltransferase [Usitatibacter sp.]